MNPLYWENAVQRLQRNVDPNHQSGLTNNIGDASKTNNDWDHYFEHSRYTTNEPHNSMGVNVGWEGLSPSFHNFCNTQPVEEPDGEPLEIDKEDPELARKRKELREIEEQIMRKKVALALKTVEPIGIKTTPGFSCNEQSTACKGESLRDRVKVILQQRHSLSFLLKSPKERTNFTGLRNNGLLYEDHPLKLRVKALMKQRCSDPCVQTSTMEVPDAKLPPPNQNSCSPARENTADKGFQRFLSVLNKGVDMDLLSRIVNDDSEDLPLGGEMLSIQLPAVGNKSELSFRSESQQSKSGASMPGPSQTSNGERKAESLSTERSHNETHPLPDDGEKKNGYSSFGSSSRSKSPPTAKKEKTKKIEEKPKMDEQREQLQNILKTLGLDLEVEEMSKLADRTQERLYGKKHEGRHRPDNRGEQRSRLRASQRHYRNLSSSSFSSSSSRSTSRSLSPSPSHRRRSHSRNSKQRRTPEASHFRGRSRDRSKGQDVNQDGREAQRPRYRDKDENDYQHAPDQTYPHPHPDGFSSFPDYTLSQYSQCTAYHNDTYSGSTDSYWTYSQGAIPPSGFPRPQNTYHQFPGPVATPNMVYPHHKNLEDMSFFLNPDLSTSEGQIGSASGLRCLQVIRTKESSPKKYITQLTRGHKRRGNHETYMKKRRLFLEKRKEERIKKKQQKLGAIQSSLRNVELSSQVKEAEQSEDIKQELTEEEIKANLRKKLEAFNQKVKQQVARPVAQPDDSFTG